MAKVELKQPIVEEISESIKDAQGVVLVDHRGLTVEEDTRLRKQLREAGVVYKVYKNTMMKRAFDGTQFEDLNKHLEGPSAIAISKEDATAPARILSKFAKEAPALELKAGVVEGNYYDVDGIKSLASIPSREELLSKLLGSMQSPIANFARVVDQIAKAKEDIAKANSTNTIYVWSNQAYLLNGRWYPGYVVDQNNIGEDTAEALHAYMVDRIEALNAQIESQGQIVEKYKKQLDDAIAAL